MPVPDPDQPRSLGDPEARAQRRQMLREPHVQIFTDYVDELRGKLTLRSSGEIVVPYIDPLDGGVDARLLFLLEKPGPKAEVSGFISRDNDDPTAENVFNYMKAAEIPRKDTLLWNVIPSWNGMTKFAHKDVHVSLPHLNDLISKLKRLERIVFVGKTASAASKHVSATWPSIQCCSSPHPSNRNINPRPWMKQKIIDAWREAGAGPIRD